MRVIFMLFLLFSTIKSVSQNKVVGFYRTYFGEYLEIKADSTFKYTWHFDLSSSWSKGSWSIKNDTIYFKIVTVFDTLRTFSNGKTLDSLVLSDDENVEVVIPNSILLAALSSGGQNRNHPPEKLLFKGNRLYGIKDGKRFKKRLKGFWTRKKFPPWYFRIIQKD